MKKREFLDALRQTLSMLPPQELEKQLTYYDEMLTDMIEDGMSEEEARKMSEEIFPKLKRWMK